jgi:hypothetical protein
MTLNIESALGRRNAFSDFTSDITRDTNITSVIAANKSPPSSTFEFRKGLDFIQSHFQGALYPRTISTRLTKGAQITVQSKEEALAKFKAADYLDCKINAYSKVVEWKGINLQAPDFLFIDLDQGMFKSGRKELDKVLSNTLKNINEKFKDNIVPTILWSGHGYHIYLPVDAFILEKESEFNRFGNPSRKFIQFAEYYLSDNKADPEHTKGLSFKNCMLRIPGSYNSKNDDKEQVLVLQSWDCYRPSIRPLLYRFDLYLLVSKSNELCKQKTKHKSYVPRYSTDWSKKE